MLTRNLQDTEFKIPSQRPGRKKGLWKLILFSLPALFWLVVIFILISLPSSNFDESSYLSGDKLIHGMLFFVLVILLKQGFYKQQYLAVLRYENSFYALAIGFFFSGTTELVQGLLVSSRYADPFDFIANSLGCLLGALFFNKIVLTKK